jgi:hypothetical protein
VAGDGIAIYEVDADDDFRQARQRKLPSRYSVLFC